jgi:hypothetical protein
VPSGMITKVDLNQASAALTEFRDVSLKRRLSSLERSFGGHEVGRFDQLLQEERLSGNLLADALAMKDASSQISEIVHALGILRSLPLILDRDERVESLSLGAGNTGRPFDLETNIRIAEFKFIEWKGADAVRQDSLFKDFYELAEFPSNKAKYLYVVGLDYPLKFLRGGRACKSVMSRHKKTWEHFSKTYETKFATVADYFEYRQHLVKIVDLTGLLPEMADR